MPPPIAPRIEELHRQFSNTIVSNDKPEDPKEQPAQPRPDSGMSSQAGPSSPPAPLQRKRSILIKNTNTDSRVDEDTAASQDEEVLTSADEHDDLEEDEQPHSPASADTPETPTTDIYALQAENVLLSTQLQHEREERERLESEVLTMRMAHERQISNLETQLEELRDELDCLKKASMSRDASGLLTSPKPVDSGYLNFDINDRQKSRAMMAAAAESPFNASDEHFEPASSLESKLQEAHQHVEARKPKRRFSFFSRRRAESQAGDAKPKNEGKTDRRKSKRALKQAKKAAKRMSRQASKQSIDPLDNGNVPLVNVEDDDELPDHLPGESRSASQTAIEAAEAAAKVAEAEAEAAAAEEARVAKRKALAERRAKIKADRIANEEKTLQDALALIDDL
eukprot:m.175392 g.175392  ORF g.175392 m.175392 type:complete len:397 (-) comp16778_c0_seq2:2861-4051(-)